jgi:hypothetical protein
MQAKQSLNSYSSDPALSCSSQKTTAGRTNKSTELCVWGRLAKSGLLLGNNLKFAVRTLSALMFGHVANAAFVRSCSGALFAVHQISPEQPFRLVTHVGSQSDLSPQATGNHM